MTPLAAFDVPRPRDDRGRYLRAFRLRGRPKAIPAGAVERWRHQTFVELEAKDARIAELEAELTEMDIAAGMMAATVEKIKVNAARVVTEGSKTAQQHVRAELAQARQKMATFADILKTAAELTGETPALSQRLMRLALQAEKLVGQ